MRSPGRIFFFVDEIRTFHGGPQGAHHDRPPDRIGDFGMTAAQSDAPVRAGLMDIGHDLDDPGRGRTPGKQQSGHEPLGDGAGGGNIIGIDQYGVSADPVGDKGDGI